MKKKSKSTGAKVRKLVRKDTSRMDITELMLRDHKPLKRLIKIMKKPENDLAKLRAAFEEFAPLLEAHAVPEQESLYHFMEDDEESEIRVEGFEGFAEHGIADELAKRIPGISDEDDWKAQVKILAELVEHHIEEEEEEMIPDLRKEVELEDREEIGQEYIARRTEFGVDKEESAA